MSEMTLRLGGTSQSPVIPLAMDYENQVSEYMQLRLRPDEMPFSHEVFDDYAQVVLNAEVVVGNPPRETELPAVGINEFLFPTGMSRFGRGLFLIGKEHIGNLVSHCWDIAWDGTGEIPTNVAQPRTLQPARLLVTDDTPHTWQFQELYLLSPIQVDSAITEKQLFICPMVDVRWFGLHYAISADDFDVDCTTTWSDLIANIDNSAPSLSNFTGTWSIPAVFLQPDPGYFSASRSYAYAMDHIAASTANRAVIDGQGLVSFQSVTQANATAAIPDRAIFGASNAEGSIPDWVRVSYRKLFDHADSETWATSEVDVNDHGAGGDLHLVTTFYEEYYSEVVDPQSEQDRIDLVEAMAAAAANWCPMTTHLELARIQLDSTGIPQGATTGNGTIIELETPYNGNSNTVEVRLIYPASQAIPGLTVLSCYFQSNEGWYIVQGEPGPAGSGQTPWIRFRAKNPVGYQRSGIWNVIVTQVRNGDGTTVSVGDEVEVNDVSNLFADVVFSAYQSVTRCQPEDFLGGSTGTAYLRTPATSDNIPDDVTRWEVETCSRSIDRIEAKLVDCMRAYKQNGDTFTGQAYLDTNMPWWNLSAYPAVDFPPEIYDNDISEIPYCWKIDYENPLALTAKNQSTVILRRHTNKLPSMPTNADMPHDNGVVGNSEKWYVEQVYEKRSGDRGSFARYITVTKGGPWNDYSLVSYWDGQNPTTPVDDVCEPGIVCLFDCACVEDGDTLFGIYNEVGHEYQLIATASAMLGAPQDLDVFTDASSAACGFNFLKQPTKAFTCGESPVVHCALGNV